ncbi:ferrous iron transport protein A [Geomonas sp. RF6]|uniref:FeoA family protein n=1 Tax=Geomonas sp. RF6 TaxID=2897342 RepID=UPI001E5EEDDF|nr:FeoA family protein [Geomonas sp. RF6]UFS70812.1 ferrous iron transport protein A [Geomonas sp. RF6]
MPLGLLSAGETGEIAAVKVQAGAAPAGCCESREKCDCRIEDMGLRVGKRVEMLNNGGGGAVLLRVDEARIAVDRSLAMKIFVKEVRQ